MDSCEMMQNPRHSAWNGEATIHQKTDHLGSPHSVQNPQNLCHSAWICMKHRGESKDVPVWGSGSTPVSVCPHVVFVSLCPVMSLVQSTLSWCRCHAGVMVQSPSCHWAHVCHPYPCCLDPHHPLVVVVGIAVVVAAGRTMNKIH